MSWFLGIDSSSVEFSAGLYYDNKPAGAVSRYIANSHAETITAAVEYLMQSHLLTFDQLAGIGVAVGPGSFTGLRIGLAFLKGACFNRNIPVLPVSSLMSCGLSAVRMMPEEQRTHVRVLFDARRDAVYHACYNFTSVPPSILTPVQLLEKPALLNMYTTNEYALTVTDTLGYFKSTIFDSLPLGVRVISVDSLPMQRGMTCAELAATCTPQDSEWIDSTELTPDYIRLAAPEEKRQAIREEG